jgi:photosystem II stability/assembly factor-like uncharacterized protein
MKKIIFLCIISFFLTNICFSQSGWFTLNSGTGYRLNSIYFYNENTGYIVGDSGILGGPDMFGIIIKTTNGGVNWIRSYTSIGLFDIVFTNLDNGYIIGSEPYTSSFFITSNGGINWSENLMTCCASALFFVNQYTAYTIGGGGLVLKSTNSGINWNSLYSGNNYYQCDVFFVDPLIGYIVGAQAYNVAIVLKTLNGGVNWSSNLVYPGKIFNEIYFINILTGYIVGGKENFYQSSGIILKTTNAGNNWYVKCDSIDSDMSSVFIVNDVTGYAVGDRNGLSVGNKVLKTTDGGDSWSNQQIPVTWGLKSVFFVNAETGYISGYHGTLLKTTNGGITGITEKNQNFTYSLSQNYPNPFNPVTRIKYDIPLSRGVSEGRGVLVKLIIYDILGREIETLVNETQKPGSYEVDWDGSRYASGVYFYRLFNDDASAPLSITKKMVLIK